MVFECIVSVTGNTYLGLKHGIIMLLLTHCFIIWYMLDHIAYVVLHMLCQIVRIFYFDSDGSICEQNPVPGVRNGSQQCCQLCAAA